MRMRSGVEYVNMKNEQVSTQELIVTKMIEGGKRSVEEGVLNEENQQRLANWVEAVREGENGVLEIGNGGMELSFDLGKKRIRETFGVEEGSYLFGLSQKEGVMLGIRMREGENRVLKNGHKGRGELRFNPKEKG